MKRLLSILLTVAMLATMLSVPMVVGAEQIAGNMKLGLGEPTANGGLFGKAANEFAKEMKSDNPENGEAKAQFAVTSTAGFDFSDKKYIVLDLNVAPNGNATAIAVGPNAGLFTITSSAFVKNAWNNVRIVVEEKTADEMQASGTYQPMTLYVNGVLVGEKASALTGGDKDAVGTQAYGKAFRFNIKGAAKNCVVGYVADVKLYASDVNEAPDVADILPGSNYSVENNKIFTDGTATVADLITDNSTDTVTVYADDTFSTVLDSSAALQVGNVVTTKTADGAYNAYDVANENVNELYEANDGTIPDMSKGNVTIVTGIAGKALNDKIAYLETDFDKAYDGNIMISKGGFYTKSKKYLVMEASVNPVDGEYDMTGVSVHTNGHGTVATAVKVPMGEWSKYLMYVDFEENKTYTYLNGEFIRENAPSAAIFNEKATLRFCFNGVMEGNPPDRIAYPFSVYADDLVWYETDIAPDGVASTARPVIAASDKYIETEGKILALATTTVADIKAANAGARVYKDGTLTAYADDSELIKLGMVIVLEGANKAITKYPVTVDYSEKILDMRTGDDKYPFPSVGNGAVQVVPGIGGKDESDKIQSVTVTSSGNGDTFLGLKAWGNVVKTGDDNSVTPSWDKTDYNGYLVIEFSIFNIDNTNVSVVTTQSSQISANVANFLPQKRWARVKVVYNALDGDPNEGYALAYVNGVQVGGWNKASFGAMGGYATNNYMKNDIRLSIKGGTKDQVSSYIDDIKVYETPVLRADEVIDFVVPNTCVVADGEFRVVEGSDYTVADIKNANIELPVKVFNNVDEYAELADDAVLVPGNVVYVAKQSEASAEAGIYCEDLFLALLVAESSATKDIITEFPATATRGEVADFSGALYGKESDTAKKVIGPSSEGNWYTQHAFKGVSTGMSYVVLETEIAPTANISSLFIGTNGHRHISPMIDVGMDLVAETWNKLVVVYNPADEICDVYANGKAIAEGVAADAYASKDCIRFVVYGKDNADCYIDNYKIYESAVYPVVGGAAEFETGYNAAFDVFVDNEADTISVLSGTTSDIAVPGYDIAVYDGDYNAVVGTVFDGNILMVQKDGNYAYYTIKVLEENDIVVLGDTYKDGVMTAGDIAVYGVTGEEAVVVVAQYDENGAMIKTAMSDVGSGVINVDFTSETMDDATVKVFLFKNGQLKPLCPSKNIAHSMTYNLLMLGNSFSMDVTCYMEEIAAAQGKGFNMAVLNKGGSAVSYHYTNREMDLAKSDIMFWLNDKQQGYSNLKTVLENYDWDYVVIQNWGSDVSFYANTDANYEKNWAVITDLAKYIHDKEPEAELMLHETWSFEAGYNSWTDAAVRDEAGANIRAVYNRCAADMKAELGLDYDVRKISSLDAFEAARAYNGGAMFETTYYKDGHLFAGYENRATAPVGDGSILLSPEDAAAGKVSLHRDGFHASAAARYLIALNAVQFLTGKSVYGNTFRPGEIALDSSAFYGGDEVTDLDNATGGVIMQKYDPLAEDVVIALQTIVEGMR